MLKLKEKVGLSVCSLIYGFGGNTVEPRLSKQCGKDTIILDNQGIWIKEGIFVVNLHFFPKRWGT